MNSRYIAKPLHLLDCDYPVDSSSALIFTTEERARDLRQKPVFFESWAMYHRRGRLQPGCGHDALIAVHGGGEHQAGRDHPHQHRRWCVQRGAAARGELLHRGDPPAARRVTGRCRGSRPSAWPAAPRRRPMTSGWWILPGAQLFKPLRQVIESVNDTFKGQLDLEKHGGHTLASPSCAPSWHTTTAPQESVI